MTRINILEANGIQMKISKDRKKRVLEKGYISKEFFYHYNIKIDELKSLFGEIAHEECW